MIRSAIQSIKDQKSVIFLIYGVQFLFAFGLGMQVWHVMEASIGDSLSMDVIQEGFNRTVFEDFMQVHGASITPLIGILRWIVPVYLLFTILFHNGIIYNLTNGKKTIKSWIRGGANYFFRSMVITLAGLAIMVLITLVIWLLFFAFTGNPLTFFDSEKPLIFWMAGLMGINVLMFGIIWWWSFSIRTSMISREINYIPWRNGTRVFKQGLGSYFMITIVFIIVNMLIYFIYAVSTNDVSAKNIWVIVVLFVFQQLFNICRISLKVGYFKSLINSIRH